MSADDHISSIVQAFASPCVDDGMTVTGANINIVGKHAIFTNRHFRTILCHRNVDFHHRSSRTNLQKAIAVFKPEYRAAADSAIITKLDAMTGPPDPNADVRQNTSTSHQHLVTVANDVQLYTRKHRAVRLQDIATTLNGMVYPGGFSAQEPSSTIY